MCVCVRVSGTYKVDVKLGGTAIIGSPFFVKSFDKSKVRVFGLSDGVVDKTTTFTGSSANTINVPTALQKLIRTM